MAASTEEATRLQADAERLYGQGKYDDALSLVQRESLEDARKKFGLSEAVRKAGPFILSF